MLLVPCPTWVSVPTRSWDGVGDEGAGRGLLLKMIYGSRSDQGIRDKSEQKIPIAGRRARLRVGENTSVVPQRWAESFWDSPERRTPKQKTSFQKQRGSRQRRRQASKRRAGLSSMENPRAFEQTARSRKVRQRTSNTSGAKKYPLPPIESCR